MRKLLVRIMVTLFLLSGCAPKAPVYNEPDLTPPTLTVTCGEATVEAGVYNGYNWEARNEDGEWFGVDAMCQMIKDLEDSITVLETTEPTVELKFAIEPDVISVSCCSDIIWRDSDAYAPDTDLEVADGKITLKPGGNIYKVRANWSAEKRDEKGVMGSVSYCFYVRATPTQPPKMTVGAMFGEMTAAMKGTYSWTYRETADTFGTVIACGEGMPGLLQDMLSPIKLPAESQSRMLMLFEDAPDSISVRGWNVNGQEPNRDWEPIEVSESRGGSLFLDPKDGDYIYEVTAEWDEGDLYWGDAIYHFRVDKQP